MAQGEKYYPVSGGSDNNKEKVHCLLFNGLPSTYLSGAYDPGKSLKVVGVGLLTSNFMMDVR